MSNDFLNRLYSLQRGNKSSHYDCLKQLIDWWVILAQKGKKIELPLVFTTEEGDISFEWRGDKKWLDITYSKDGVWDYIKGDEESISEGRVQNKEEIIELLEFLGK